MLLPPKLNRDYAGPAWLPYVMIVLGFSEFIPALIHSFAPDGGAFSIAGLDHTPGRHEIIGLFAWAGATQLVFGLVILGTALRYRVFLPLILLLMLIEKSCIALNGWVLKPGAGAHHPPGLYGVLVALPILSGLLVASTRKKTLLS